jgi:hypothetical protein
MFEIETKDLEISEELKNINNLKLYLKNLGLIKIINKLVMIER